MIALTHEEEKLLKELPKEYIKLGSSGNILENRIAKATAYLHGLTIFGTQEQRDNISGAILILQGKA